VWVAGGRQARDAGVADRSHRALYDRGVLAGLDPHAMRLSPRLDRAGGRFGAPSADVDGLVLCTEREVLRLGPDGLVATTHPWLADVHHAITDPDGAVAVSTAFDGVVFLPSGRFASVDGRGDPSGPAPARARTHPNHAFRVDGALWVTRGIAGDAVRVGAAERWVLAEETVHDGVVAGDGVWFTAVDGRLLRVDPESGRVTRTIDLRSADDGPEPLGWCRGLALLDGVAFVGFTRIRTTAWRARLAWTRGALRGKRVATRRPTRVDAYELATGRRIASVPTSEVGLDAIFGLVVGGGPGR
jgi:hypothetical protein